jgi:hypothetical protein
MGRLDRFLKLERPRPPHEETAASPRPRDRFAQSEPVARPAEPLAGPSASGVETGRFAAAAEPGEKKIAALEDDGGQPFIRCRNCRTDNHLTALTCAFCEANLTTPPQRAYNEALWRRHTAEKAELQSHVQALEASRREADQEAYRAIQQSLTFESYPGAQDRDDEPPLGVRLARRIRDPRLRLAVLIAIGAVPLYLLFFGGTDARFIGYFLCLIVGFLFSPRNLRRWLRGGAWNPRVR